MIPATKMRPSKSNKTIPQKKLPETRAVMRIWKNLSRHFPATMDIHSVQFIQGRISASFRSALLPRITKYADDRMGKLPNGFVPIVEKLYGKLSDAHVFSVQSLPLGFDLKEPQTTRILAYLLDPQKSGEDACLRCQLFVEALYKTQAPQLGPPPEIDLMALRKTVSVEAEVRFPTGKSFGSIDLVITWHGGDEKVRIIGIENKITHDVMYGQLKKYRQYLLKKVHDESSLALFLLAPDTRNYRRSIKQNQKWKFSGWLSTLRQWEKLLALNITTNDNDINRLRKALWETTTV